MSNTEVKPSQVQKHEGREGWGFQACAAHSRTLLTVVVIIKISQGFVRRSAWCTHLLR